MNDRVLPGDAVRELVRLSRSLDDALNVADDTATAYAASDANYRATYAAMFLRAKDDGVTDGVAHERAKTQTVDERRRFVYARQAAQVSLEAIRSRRTQISAWQTAGNAIKAELDMARTGPQHHP